MQRKNIVVLAAGVDPRRAVRILTVTVQAALQVDVPIKPLKRSSHTSRSEVHFGYLISSSIHRVCERLQQRRNVESSYSCNVTITNQRDAPWIHACGEDDEFFCSTPAARMTSSSVPRLRQE